MQIQFPKSVYLFDKNGIIISELSRYGNAVLLYIADDANINDICDFNKILSNEYFVIDGIQYNKNEIYMPNLPTKHGYYVLNTTFGFGPVDPDIYITAKWLHPTAKFNQSVFTNQNTDYMKSIGWEVTIVRINSFIAYNNDWCIIFSCDTNLPTSTVYPKIYIGRLVAYWFNKGYNHRIGVLDTDEFIDTYKLKDSIKILRDII